MDDKERQVLIVRQSSLKTAAEFLGTRVGNIDMEGIILWASRFEDWVWNGNRKEIDIRLDKFKEEE